MKCWQTIFTHCVPTLSTLRSDEAHGTRIETHELVEASEVMLSSRSSPSTPDHNGAIVGILNTPGRSSPRDCTPSSTSISDSGRKRRLQVLSSEWDCVFSNCNGYLTLLGYIDESGEKTVVSCQCSSASSRGYGDCSAKYLIAKFITSCKLCKGTVRPMSFTNLICDETLISVA